MQLICEVKRLHPMASIPTKAYETDMGWDFYACLEEPVEITPRHRVLIPTGVAISLPPGHGMLLRDRSGNAVKDGLTVFAGVIDQDFSGEVKVCLFNSDSVPRKILPNQRIAQGIILPVPQVQMKLVDDLKDTDRGEKGFGSSGK